VAISVEGSKFSGADANSGNYGLSVRFPNGAAYEGVDLLLGAPPL
jgi:hypothetical protein